MYDVREKKEAMEKKAGYTAQLSRAVGQEQAGYTAGLSRAVGQEK